MFILKEVRVPRPSRPTGSGRKKYLVECECGKQYTINPEVFREDKYCRECSYKHRRGNPLECAKNAAYAYHRSKVHGSLPRKIWDELVESPCVYCECETSKEVKYTKGKGATYRCNTVDRLDSNKGYLPGNCVPCCVTCNGMKSNRTLEDFLNHIAKWGADIKLIKERIEPWLI